IGISSRFATNRQRSHHMSVKSSASRYARALFDVVQQEGDVAAVDRDLTAVVSAVREHMDALMPALSPSVPDAVRGSVAEALVDKLGSNGHVRKLVGVLAASGRFELLPHVAAAYNERLLAHQNVVRAEVTSASPLTPENISALEASLGRATGKKVEL